MCSALASAGAFCAPVGPLDVSGRAQTGPSLFEVELPAGFATLDRDTADVTGDGILDIICLAGRKESPTDLYSQETLVLVKDGNSGKQLQIPPGPLSGAYEGTVFLGDFNGDHVSDLLVSLPAGGSGGLVLYSVLSCAGGAPQVLLDQRWLSQGPQFDVRFEDGFRTRVSNHELRRSFALELPDPKQRYVEMGVYDAQGQLLKATSGVCDAYSLLQPQDLDRDGIFELVGFQSIWGLYHADTIGIARSVWRWRDQGWELRTLTVTRPEMAYLGSYETPLSELLRHHRRITLTLRADGAAYVTLQSRRVGATEVDDQAWTGRWRYQDDGTVAVEPAAESGTPGDEALQLRLRGDELIVTATDPGTYGFDEIVLTRIPRQPPAVTERPAPGHTFHGELALGPEARVVTLCGTDQKAWVTDRTGELWDIYERLAGDSYEQVFVEVRGLVAPPVMRGVGSAYPHHIVVTEVRRAASEGYGCEEDLRGVEFRAFGTEPFWDLTISEKGMRFFELSGSLRQFPYVRPNVSDGRWVYYSARDGSDDDWIIVILDEERCADDMSGAHFSFSAHVILGEQHYRGCGREGFHPSE